MKTDVSKDATILQRPRGCNKGNKHSTAPAVTSHDYANNNPVCTEKIMQIANIADTKSCFANPERGRVYDICGLAPTIKTVSGGGLEPKIITRTRLRRLTPRECFRLMDVSEQDIDTIQSAGISNSQQYKLAGNSIVVVCMTEIFKKLFNK